MGLIRKIRNWQNSAHPAAITFRNIWAVIQAFFRKRAPITPEHIKEQAEWRLTQVREECKANDSCIICGCVVSEKVWEDRPCEGNCYPTMMEKDIWKRYKKRL